MTVYAAVAELIRISREGMDVGAWRLSDKDRLALGRLVTHLDWVDPAQLGQPTVVRLHDAAAEVAVAAVAVAIEGELSGL